MNGALVDRTVAHERQAGALAFLVFEGPGGGDAASVQVVLGRIAPPRSGPEQPGLSKSELEGAMTLNVRLVDPSLTGAQGVNALRDGGEALALES